ncbi:MAG: hypothetical protein M3P18_01325 [Actinomycetota bacterium]|nr:hypothetical protein [Actinomycetota bacterium]
MAARELGTVSLANTLALTLLTAELEDDRWPRAKLEDRPRASVHAADAGILRWIARIFTSEGNVREAVLLLGAAKNVVAETGMTLDREERERLGATLSAVSQDLSEAEVEALLEEGQRLTRDDAVALALNSQVQRTP